MKVYRIYGLAAATLVSVAMQSSLFAQTDESKQRAEDADVRPVAQEVMQEPYTEKQPALAGMLSAVLPGGGQFYNGQGGKGALMLAGSAGAIVPRQAPSSTSTWGLSITASPRPCSSSIARRTASSDGVRWGSGATSVDSRPSMYQVTSTPAHLAPVEARWLRETVASP